MKLSKREKGMLILLACIAIIALGFIYIITPELERLETVKQENLKYIEEVDKVKRIISDNNRINKSLEDALAKTREKSSRFYPELIQDRLILIIDDIIKKSGLQVDNLTFNGIKAGDIIPVKTSNPPIKYNLKDMVNAYVSSEDTEKVQNSTSQTNTVQSNQAASKAAALSSGQNSLESLGITIQIKGEYEQIIRLMAEIEAQNRTIIVNNITIANSAGTMTGVLNLTFYGIAKMPGTDILYGDWIYNNEYGKANPFK